MALTGTVLILDDSLTVRMDLVEAFTEAGWRTAPCATAAQAWEVLATGHIDAIVLDVLLPDADGVDVLHALRAQPATASVPVLMLSTEAQVKDRIRGLQTGADEYVGKPYDSAYLVARAQELVHQPAPCGTVSQASAVLVIASSPDVREPLEKALGGSGHTVVAAATGLEGLRVAAAHRADAVIVHGALPDMEGTTVIRRLRLDAALRGAFCLLLARSDDVSAQLHALESGADAFAREDEPIEMIAAKVSAALRQTSQGSLVGTASLLAPKKILAIGGGDSLPALLTDRVRGEGYDVVPAQTGGEALELLAIQTVDCILLQVGETGEPDDDGLQLCRRIKSVPELRDVPLLLLSNHDGQQLMVDALAVGADDYVRTGGDFEVLAARIRAQLRRKQLQEEHRQIRETLLRKEIEATQARAQAQIAQTRAAMVEELERKNQELEAFSYSVSHDLRAPLRTVGGFTSMLVESLGDHLDETGQHYVDRINSGLRRMTEMIDDLLELSRVGRAPVQRGDVDLAEVAHSVLADLATGDPGRTVIGAVQSPLQVFADRRLIRNVFENLLGNAWKFTAHAAQARIEVGAEITADEEDTVYFIRDNGDGFDMAHAQKLFSPFQRLHHQSDFPGTGIGLATVHRIIDRHGGRVWADAQPGAGATFRFTLPAQPAP